MFFRANFIFHRVFLFQHTLFPLFPLFQSFVLQVIFKARKLPQKITEKSTVNKCIRVPKTLD